MSIYLNPDFTHTGGIPPDTTPVDEKALPEYSLEWSKYIYSSWVMGQTAINGDVQDKIALYRKYADGKQDWQQYKRKFEPQDTNTRTPISSVLNDINSDGEGGTYLEDVSQAKGHMMAVDYTKIFSPAPKYINALIGMFLQSSHDITVTALDTHSKNKRQEQKWNLWVQSKYKEAFDQIDQKLGIPPPDDQGVLPKSIQELDLYETIKGFKLRYETAMEDALIHTENISEITEIMKKVVFDLAVGGYAFASTDKDRNTQKMKYQYRDVCDCIIEHSNIESDKNSRFGAYVEYFTISQLSAILPEVDEREWYDLANKYVGLYGNPNKGYDYIDSKTNPAYFYYRVPVLRTSWETVDYLKKKKEVQINGKVRPSELKKGKVKQFGQDYIKEVDTDAGQQPAVYGARWVMGTDYIFDHERLEDDCGELPLKCYIMRGTSIMEQMIPILDQLHMTFLRLQNAIAKAPPAGLLIDVAGMKGFKMGNKKWRESDLIKLYTASGNLLYDSSLRKGLMPNDKVDSRKVVEQLPGGMGPAINEFLISFEMGFNHIAELTGLTRESFASQGDPNQTATATKILAAGTSNTLQPLYSGWVNMRRGLSQAAAQRIQIICMRNDIPEDKGYVPVIGEYAVRAIADLGKKSPSAYGIEITPAMTQEEKMELRRHIQEAELKGYIEPDVAMFITSDILRGLSLTKAQMYLSYRIQLAKQQQAQQAQQAQLVDRETQQVVSQGKAENDVQLEKVKSDEKIRQINAEKQWDYDIKMLDVQMKDQELLQKSQEVTQNMN